MSAFLALRTYYTLFGRHGVWLGTKARLLRRPIKVRVESSCVRYPICIRLKTTDVSALWHILAMSEYDCELSKRPRVIVDAGANIGLTSVFYANKYPEARIIAIEPEASNYEILKENTRPYPNVVTVRAALWKADREIDLLDPGYGNHGFQTKGQGEDSSGRVLARTQGMTVTSVMRLCELGYIDMLKVDIEGSEKEVFEHSSSWMHNVGVIAIETHEQLRKGCEDAVRRATGDFDSEWQKDQTLFLARREYATGEGQVKSNSDASQCHTKIMAKPRFRILETV